MKIIIAALGLLLSALYTQAQPSTGAKTNRGETVPAEESLIQPLTVGDRLPDLPVKNIINYEDCAVSLSSFGNKILILDFWNIHCTSCIRMFPLEDSLQAMFPNDVQFILITRDSKERVSGFLSKYNSSHKKPLALPVVFDDSAFRKLFRFFYIPHYVWIAPNGTILAQTEDSFINAENIANTLIPIRAEEKRLQGNKYADLNLEMMKPSKELLQLLSLTDN